MLKIINRMIFGALPLFFICSFALADRQESDDESHISDPRIQHRNYSFPPTGEKIPYALFVPSTYNEGDLAPLIISLHGLGRSYDWLMGYHGFLDQAEANGYIAEIDVPNYGKTKVVTNVVQLSDTPGLGATRPPPKLGEHTSEIMVSLGFSPDEVAEVLSPIEAAAAEIIGLVIS